MVPTSQTLLQNFPQSFYTQVHLTVCWACPRGHSQTPQTNRFPNRAQGPPPQTSPVFHSFPITFTQFPKPETGNPPGCLFLTPWHLVPLLSPVISPWRLLYLTGTSSPDYASPQALSPRFLQQPLIDLLSVPSNLPSHHSRKSFIKHQCEQITPKLIPLTGSPLPTR